MGNVQIAGAPLRARARVIRGVASQLTARDLDSLTARAGNDTWEGPTPQRCLDDLLRVRRELVTAHEELLAAALRLEADAERLDTAMLIAARAAVMS